MRPPHTRGKEPDDRAVLASAHPYKAVAAFDTHNVILDMTYCEPLDAIGLGLLVTIDRDLRAAGRRLILLRPSASSKRMLAITGVDQLLAGIE